jgi:hypothetical protein
MLDPKRCVITRNPVVLPGGVIEYTATMTFHIRETIQAELEQRDLKTDGALDPRVVDRLQKLVWKAVYGDLISPVTHLIAQATQLCNRSMPEPRKQITYLAAQLVTMLKIKLIDPPKKTKPDAGPVTG